MSEPMMNDKLRKKPENTNLSPETSPNIKGSKETGGLSLLARVSTLSWDLVIPIVGGVLLGTYIDKRTGSDLSWTLSLLVLGIFIAFGNLYNLYVEQGSSANPGLNKRPDDEVLDEQDQ